VIVSGVHVELTNSLKELVSSKAQKLFDHDGKIIRIEVNLEHSKNRSRENEFIAHGEIAIGGHNLNARAKSEDMYKSIDMMINKLDRQLIDKIKVENDRKRAESVPADTYSTEIT
ncbi:MAG: ribosome-associated translation inhibitor RaiA, partial [Puniceicoccales bacterium]|jgi:putative sigma-54 modulation protein|nr:ribosome-associated translation inhibitor RaiA [Puniceicoccales bacterium]